MRLERLPEDVGHPSWDEARAAAVLARAKRTRRGEQRRTRVLRGVAVLAPVVAAAVWLSVGRPRAPERTAHAPATPAARLATGSLVLHDGSRAEALGVDSELVAVEDRPARAVLALNRGAARFEVVPDAARRFRVLAGDVSVQALGTVFTVAHEAERVRVAVLVGRVAVAWPQGDATLSAGEAGTFPPEPTGPRGSERPPVQQQTPLESPATSGEPAPMARARPAHADWRKLARARAFDRAFAAMQRSDGAAVRDVANELMLASDVARRTGHLTLAATHLRRILEAHGGDPVAPVAAVTLGRVEQQAGHDRAAALAFERVVELAPKHPLAEAALAGAASAWSRAGDPARARVAAERYLASFPGGRHAATMRGLLLVK